MTDWSDATALIVVDVQVGFGDETYWGPRNNPLSETNIEMLVAAWRDQGWPIVYVRHDSAKPGSPLQAGTPGNQFMPFLRSVEPDLLVTKSVHSAFLGEPDLHGWLTDRNIRSVAVCGIQTNMCCETTARDASDLGYSLLFILDATHTYDITAGGTGKVYRARELSRYTAVNIEADFGQVVYTAELLGGIEE
jgi:nicotinamidase-related amidase